MKTIFLSFRLFIRKPFANAVLSVELALVTLIVVVVGNIYQYSQTCINVVQNSSSRVMYCSNPEPFAKDKRAKFVDSLKAVQKKYSYVKGFSDIDYSVFCKDKEVFENPENDNGRTYADSPDIVVYDDETISSLQLPVSEGECLSTKKVNGRVPCVLGGINAKKYYHVGDTISGYTLADRESTKAIKTPDFYVAGILALPQQSFDTGISDNGENTMKISELFEDMTNCELFMVVPGSLFNGMRQQSFGGMGAFVYLNRDCTQTQIDAVRNELHRGYTQMDTEMIDAERKDINQTLSIMMPFLIMLFLVIFLGLIAVCMLTAMKNMQTFKVYYLTGCPRRKILLIMLCYVLYYFVIAGVLFTVLLQCGKHMVHQLRMLEAYFIFQPGNLISIGIVCAVVLVSSLIIPFVIIKKNSLSDLLRKD